MEHREGAGRFVIRVTLVHVVTYLLVGIIASIAFDYETLFEQPVIRDYMQEFGSVSLFVGPVVQVVRGVIIAAVLLPFRRVLAARLGWLWLWLLLVGIGILSTSAAAPSSIEGLVYTRVPLWYHAIGLPEMLVQTLAFSLIAAMYARYPQGVLAALPPVFERIVRALVTASFAFIGYALVSVAFALVSGAGVDPEQNLSLEVQGLFIVPFLANCTIAFIANRGVTSPRWRLVAGLASYALGAASILVYQSLVSGGADPLYAFVAPTLPALIVWLLVPRERVTEPADPTLDHAVSGPLQN
ncbi:hypothetical protein [Glaciibacter superstes]|uniref:hypothetical protein n=1 Tax=Glaciibacter superstes TaxID=501023 RepID=UPI0003B69AC5|nr:hypothetical protein [Glaciibacter superstes]